MNDKLKELRPAHLAHILGEPTPPPAAKEEEEAGLPSLQDGQYLPHAPPANKPVHALHFLKPGGGRVRTFEYVDLHSRCGDDDDYDGACFRLTFLGMRAVEVTVRGRGLWRLYDYIHQHRMRWVMEAARDMGQDGDTVVTGVSVRPLAERAE